jgi:hypothetical protein
MSNFLENYTIKDEKHQVETLNAANDNSAEDIELKFITLLNNTSKELQNFGLAQEIQNRVLQAAFLKAFRRDIEDAIDGTWLAYKFNATNNEYEPLYLMFYEYDYSDRLLKSYGPEVIKKSLHSSEIRSQIKNYEFDLSGTFRKIKIINDKTEPYWLVNIDHRKMHNVQNESEIQAIIEKDIEYFKKNEKVYPKSIHASMTNFIKHYFSPPHSKINVKGLNGSWLACNFNEQNDEYEPLYIISYDFSYGYKCFQSNKISPFSIEADEGTFEGNSSLMKIEGKRHDENGIT